MRSVRTDRPRNTPGFMGYVLTFAIAVLLVSAGLTIRVDPEVDAGDFFLFAAFFGAWIAVLPAAVIVPLVHLAVRRVADQRVHVVVAGLTGLVGGAACWWFVSEGNLLEIHEDALVVAGIGLATAIGRAAVIPLVQRRRAPDFLPFWERDHNLV